MGLGANEPANFKYPVTAVNSFLKALRAKDAEGLAQATALHAETESADKNKKMFKAILDKNLPDNELNDLAGKLDGFRVVSQNIPKSTGRLGVILGKQKGNDTLQRTITVRLEKSGWKVVDIGPEGVIEGFNRMPLRSKNRGK